jgi:hypothetical protein
MKRGFHFQQMAHLRIWALTLTIGILAVLHLPHAATASDVAAQLTPRPTIVPRTPVPTVPCPPPRQSTPSASKPKPTSTPCPSPTVLPTPLLLPVAGGPGGAKASFIWIGVLALLIGAGSLCLSYTRRR